MTAIPQELGGARLQEDRAEPEVLTARRGNDCRTALMRGLAEYIQELEIDWIGGMKYRFKNVHADWSEPEESAAYPSAFVYSFGDGEYDSSRFTPRRIELPDGLVLRETAEFSAELTVEVWATDRIERQALVAMLEDAFDPLDWMSGFRLTLPHYHGVRATFEKLSSSYEDDETNAQRRRKKASLTLKANMPQLVLARALPVVDFRRQTELLDSTS